MHTIHKYDVLPSSEDLRFTLNLPISAMVLSVQMHRGKPCMWVLLDTDEETAPRSFVVAMTGQPVPTNASRFIGTFVTQQDSLVLHLFETPRF